MSHAQPRRLNSLFGSRTKKERRPEGVSRKRKKQFGFETLEDRRLMTASPLLTAPPLAAGGSTAQFGSISSATPEGELQTALRELYWQSLIASAQSGSTELTTLSLSLPNDPLLAQQWHLINTGQQVGNPDYQSIFGKPGEDLRVLPVWLEGIDGTGVRVAVIDSGTQLDHPDLAANIDLDASFDALNPSGTGNPFFFNRDNFHGTAVAGIIGAVANNGIGGSGVAPGVTLVPIRLIDSGGPPNATELAFLHATQAGVDITNNSWGPANPLRSLYAFSPQVLNVLRDSVVNGRDGKGIIHVFASGNEAGNTFNAGFTDIGTFNSANYGLANTRYVIAVTGVDHDGSYNNVDGTVTNYPEAGTNVLVAAPTGSFARIAIGDDTGIGSGIVTTDLTGGFGSNQDPDPLTGFELDRDFLANSDFTSRMNGTSAAAPMVSGVIALMLQANPNLTWRDVQEILVRSARQNDQVGIPGIGTGVQTQNTWIINQAPLFHDPDAFVVGIPTSPARLTLTPTLDPNADLFLQGGLTNLIGSDHYIATPFRLTTGAGYTVSQGIGVYGEQIGYGHGVVDAQTAVALAQQWSTKNQALPNELTFTSFVAHPGVPLNIPHAERSNDASGNQIVPGGIGGAISGGFISRWEEYFAANPDFTKRFPYRGDEYMEFSVPANNTMSIESVDVRINIGGNTAEALEHLRLTLISPDGTPSELNHYIVDTEPRPFRMQWTGLTDAHPYLGSFGTTDPNTAPLVYTFNTNRSWGERSDNRIVFDPVTGEPVIDQAGFFNGTLTQPGVPGQALKQGWRLAIENWDANDSFSLADVEIAWHGSPIAANSQRVQGFVGVDNNRDDNFNYSRVIQTISNLDNDPTTLRLGEVTNTIDLTQESFAANQTVTVRRTSDNVIVDQFVTGHDGNFYFDLVPGDYMVSVEDPEGRTAKEDTVTQGGLLRHYQSEWRITPDFFKVLDHSNVSASEVLVDGNGNPLPWLDANGQSQVYGMTGINFLLDPGAVPPQQAAFGGTVYVDVNGDGAFNGTDTLLPGASVYGDINRNGSYDSGEVLVTTDANGQYNLIVPLTQAAVMNVGVVPPAQWTVTGPSGGLHSLFAQPGTQESGLDFFLKPAANNAGGGGATQPGILLGSVFIDVNGNGARDTNEQGAAGVTVYIDDNNNNMAEVTERKAVANQFGAYVFTAVEPGSHVIRLVTEGTFQQTLPIGGAGRTVNLTGSSVISGITFGIRDAAIYDYGDLPAIYNATTLANNGARHVRGPYWLGARVDGELDGAASSGANGDDNNATQNDEDGVAPVVFTAGAGSTLTVTASRFNGYLQGWVDWNNDGDFNDANERVITNRLLNAGANSVDVSVPAGVSASQVYARLRYGEFGINSVTGAALTGEVEDYRITVVQPASPIVGVAPDFSQNGKVDGFDFLLWQRNQGRTSGATQSMGNADGDGDVDKFDLQIWEEAYGAAASAAALGSSSGSSSAALLAADESESFAQSLAGGGSAPLSVTQFASATTQPTARGGYRPLLTSVVSSSSSLGAALTLEAARRDEAFDDLFGGKALTEAQDQSEFDLSDGTLDSDAAFAALADAI